MAVLNTENLYEYKNRQHLMTIHWVNIIRQGMRFDLVSEEQVNSVVSQISDYLQMNLEVINRARMSESKIEFHTGELKYILDETLKHIAQQRVDYRVRFYHCFPWRRPLKVYQLNLTGIEAFCKDVYTRLELGEVVLPSKVTRTETDYPETFLAHQSYYCMSHCDWTITNHKGLCGDCGSAMLSPTDET